MLAFHCILQQLVGKQIFEPMKPGTHYSVPLGSKITFVEVEPLAQFSTGKMIPRLLISQGQHVLPAHANFRRGGTLSVHFPSSHSTVSKQLDFSLPLVSMFVEKSRAVKRAFGAPELPNRILIPAAESVAAAASSGSEGDQ